MLRVTRLSLVCQLLAFFGSFWVSVVHFRFLPGLESLHIVTCRVSSQLMLDLLPWSVLVSTTNLTSWCPSRSQSGWFALSSLRVQTMH